MKKGVIFAAAKSEVGGVLNSPKFGYRMVSERPFEVWENPTKAVVITGIGLANAATAFAWAAGEYDFGFAVNIGAAGAASGKFGAADIGAYFDITGIACVEPYCEAVYELGTLGGARAATLATSSRPASTAAQRARAAGFGELVDMEGWALARAAEAFSKKLFVRKILTDFSPECDIKAGILSVCTSLKELENFWI